MSVLDDMAAREAQRTRAIRDALGDRIDEVVAAQDFGQASASKRGRNPRWPYVPVIKFETGRTQQLRGLAYATRTEAVDRAQREIDAWRRKMAADLCRPNLRAFREQYGLPRDPQPSPLSENAGRNDR